MTAPRMFLILIWAGALAAAEDAINTGVRLSSKDSPIQLSVTDALLLHRITGVLRMHVFLTQ